MRVSQIRTPPSRMPDLLGWLRLSYTFIVWRMYSLRHSVQEMILIAHTERAVWRRTRPGRCGANSPFQNSLKHVVASGSWLKAKLNLRCIANWKSRICLPIESYVPDRTPSRIAAGHRRPSHLIGARSDSTPAMLKQYSPHQSAPGSMATDELGRFVPGLAHSSCPARL